MFLEKECVSVVSGFSLIVLAIVLVGCLSGLMIKSTTYLIGKIETLDDTNASASSRYEVINLKTTPCVDLVKYLERNDIKCVTDK